MYSESDCQLLERICRYRDAGLPLASIKLLLYDTGGRTASLLEARIAELNQSIEVLRTQQKGIVRLLLSCQAQKQTVLVEHGAWDGIFRAAGFNRYDQWQWHREFEAASPEQHQLFLESLGSSAGKIVEIRTWAQTDFAKNNSADPDRPAAD
jgi:DNA-binding transcriptional MerR regulator